MRRLFRTLTQSIILVLAISMWPGSALAQILKLGDLNTRQIEALDRQKTVVLIPGGILEEHGPYLPSYTDGYANEAFTQELARAIAARPGWTVVIYPQIPLGNDPANTIGGLRKFPGSYPVRMVTLRAIYMDLATELGEAGFRWIFLVHDHGAPNHHIALNQASDYFHDTYGGTMVHLFGLAPVFLCCGTEEKMLTKEQLSENGFTVHAGVGEQSQLLFLHPELVPSDYRSAPSFTGKTFADLVRISKQPGWTGYYGAPRLASAALGAQGFAAQTEKLCEIALKILDGADPRKIPRYADQMDELDIKGEAAEIEYEQSIAKRQQNWLVRHGIETTQTAAHSEKGKTNMSQQGRILGIGGIFFKSANQQEMKEWYAKHLGLADSGHGVMLPWREKENPESEQMTVWSVFSASTKYFEPSSSSFMLNYIVDDMDALLARLEKEGVKIDPKRQNESYGKFAWIYDPDGNKIELWQPIK